MILPSKRELDYLLAIDAACVFVADANGFVWLRAVRDPLKSFGKIRTFVGAQIEWMAWAHSHIEAWAVLVHAIARLPKPWCQGFCFFVSEYEARAAIEHAAQTLGITLTDNRIVLDRVRDRVARLDAYLDEQRRVGGIKFFNTAYQRYRRQRRQLGKGAMRYTDAVALLRRRIMTMAPDPDPAKFRECVHTMFVTRQSLEAIEIEKENCEQRKIFEVQPN